MNKALSPIFEETGCLSEQQLLDYLNGRLSEHETHLAEAHITDCDFCNDALEGLANVKNKEQIPIIVKQIHSQLRHELQSHQSKNKRVKLYVWLSTIIVIVLLILLIAFFAIYYSMKNNREQQHHSMPAQQTTSQLIQ